MCPVYAVPEEAEPENVLTGAGSEKRDGMERLVRGNAAEKQSRSSAVLYLGIEDAGSMRNGE